jgi:peptide/nickel transport system permease protein
MLRLVGQRLVLSVPLLFIVSALTFVLLRLVPGDAARQILGPLATPDEIDMLREQLGIDRPVWSQYGDWLAGAVHGDLGDSLFGGDVVSLLNARLAVTMSLIFGAVIVTAIVGIILGVVSAARGGFLGRMIDVVSITAFGIPGFWLASMLVVIFAVKYPIFPATGYVRPSESITGWVNSLVLPVMTLALLGMAVVARQTRDAISDVLQRDFIRNLRAAGVPERSVIWKHALRNAALPIVTVLGLQFVGLLGGTIIVEAVFGLPGMGSLVILATQRHDIPIIQGVAIYFTLIVIAVNLTLDIAYGLLNPKVRVK